MNRLKNSNQLYTLHYDGDIFLYRASLLSKPLLFLTRFQTQVEIPLNLVLSYKRRSFFFFNSYQFYINHYTSSQTRLQPVSLRSFVLLAGKKCHALEKLINDMMQRNAMGIPNMALSHIDVHEVQQFYRTDNRPKAQEHTVEKPALTKHLPQPIPEAV